MNVDILPLSLKMLTRTDLKYDFMENEEWSRARSRPTAAQNVRKQTLYGPAFIPFYIDTGWLINVSF